jgi:hypothetical protein
VQGGTVTSVPAHSAVAFAVAVAAFTIAVSPVTAAVLVADDPETSEPPIVRKAGVETTLPTYRSSAGTHSASFCPVYFARGRIMRLSSICSSTWATQPPTRLIAKMGVNMSTGMPSW